MIQFNCPHCNQQIKVPDKAAGRTGSCPKCNAKVQVPGGAASASSASAAQIPCPYCAEMIPVGASQCPYCGESLGNARPEPVPPRRPPAPRDIGRHAPVRGADRYPTAPIDGGYEEEPRPRPARRYFPRGECPKNEWDKTAIDYLTEYCGAKLLNAKGRATRREFWICLLAGTPFIWLVTCLFGAAIMFVLITFFGLELVGRWMMQHDLRILSLAPFIPMVIPFASLCARRCHDAGKGGIVGLLPIGWLGFIVIVGLFIDNLSINLLRVCFFLTALALFALVAFGLLPGESRPNQYGPDPYDPNAR